MWIILKCPRRWLSWLACRGFTLEILQWRKMYSPIVVTLSCLQYVVLRPGFIISFYSFYKLTSSTQWYCRCASHTIFQQFLWFIFSRFRTYLLEINVLMNDCFQRSIKYPSPVRIQDSIWSTFASQTKTMHDLPLAWRANFQSSQKHSQHPNTLIYNGIPTMNAI